MNKLIIPNYNVSLFPEIDIYKSPSKKTLYKGSPYYSLVSLIYIKNKFPNSCVILPNNYNNVDEHEDISIRYNEKQKKLSVPKNFWKFFNKCKNKRFTVFLFGYTCKDSGHANIMLYDNINKTLERFEPYGNIYDILDSKQKKCFNPDIDKIIFEFFDNNEVITEYFPPSTFIPNNGIQKLQEDEDKMTDYDPEGFCTMWSLFYCDLRLSNPDVDRKVLLDKTIKTFKTNNKSLTIFIRDYSNAISSLLT